MDRFKFRFWRKKAFGGWIQEYADFIPVDGSATPYENTEGGACCYYLDGTICEQCTGLRDKNGKLIFEGDVVELTRARNCGWMEKGRKLEVKYNTDRYCGFGFDGGYALTEKCANNCIVVGNIHENPELLK